jgi:indolepyruvate ferredoxin oxidoreductase
VRAPSFCSGCPHGRSTKLPDGSRALAGIGCHTMAMFVDPTKTTTVSHMGGEGAMWLGQQPFTTEKHVFANMGDGTYFHSGFLAVRQAVAAHVPITYKILHNGFVSMTGGQKIDGELSIAGIIGELVGRGVGKIALVSDDPSKWEGVALPAGVKVHHRSELDAVQREFREYPDVSVIVYDQPCATERRRPAQARQVGRSRQARVHQQRGLRGLRRLRQGHQLHVDRAARDRARSQAAHQPVVVQQGLLVHRGVLPELRDGGGRHGAQAGADARSGVDPLAAAAAAGDAAFPNLPEPAIARPERSYAIIVAGIGGTGVVTIGQTLAVAAHLEGLYSSNLDVTGLAQKYGAVLSHVKVAPDAAMLHATRVAAGEADALIGCDLIVSAGDETFSKLKAGSGGVVCTDMVPDLGVLAQSRLEPRRGCARRAARRGARRPRPAARGAAAARPR